MFVLYYYYQPSIIFVNEARASPIGEHIRSFINELIFYISNVFVIVINTAVIGERVS